MPLNYRLLRDRVEMGFFKVSLAPVGEDHL